MQTPNSTVPILREILADPLSEVWTDIQLRNAIERSIRAAWPHFYAAVIDQDTFTGLNAVQKDTRYVDISRERFQRIFAIEARTSTGTAPFTGANWYTLSKGIRLEPRDLIDYFDNGSWFPRVWFAAPLTAPLELRIHGAMELLPSYSIFVPTLWPNSCGQIPGFQDWILLRAEYEARRIRRRSRATDKRDQNTLALMAKQEADTLAERYKMRPPIETDFGRW